MEISNQDKTAQLENDDEAAEKKKSERVSEYHFFIARDIQTDRQDLTVKDAEGGEKKEGEQDRSVAFFLSDS